MIRSRLRASNLCMTLSAPRRKRSCRQWIAGRTGRQWRADPSRPCRVCRYNAVRVKPTAACRQPMSGLIAAIDRRPQAAFALFLALHVVVWTALPALLYPNLPLDLIEALTYGREWQLGYDKLPPLPWWLVEVVYRLFGVDVAYYALAQIAVVAAFALVWVMALPLVGARRRAGRGPDRRRPALLPLHRRQVQSRRDPTAVLGARRLRLPRRAQARPAAALVPARHRHRAGAVGEVFRRRAGGAARAVPAARPRRAQGAGARPAPGSRVAVALVVMAPHLVWLVQNDFLPFAYAERARRAVARAARSRRCIRLTFARRQLGFLLPALLIAAPLVWPRPQAARSRRDVAADAFDRRIVTLLAFGPARDGACARRSSAAAA